MRLLAGTVAAAPFRATLTGHRQLLGRPMSRVAEPLRLMGADVRLTAEDRPPVQVAGGHLRGIEYHLPIPSGQVKSAVLLAGLGAEGATSVVESIPSRDHLERLLQAATSVLRRESANGTIRTTIQATDVRPLEIRVPGDFSSAAALLAAVLLVPGSALVVEDIGLNPTRTGFLRVLARMGARIETEPSPRSADAWEEPRGTIRIEHGQLAGAEVGADEVPSLIDEIPLVGLLATQAEGETIVRGAAELRVKESDRISGLIEGLRALGADVEELHDGFVVRGPTRLVGGASDAREDHRLAMVFWLAGFAATGPVRVDGLSYVSDSFPGFVDQLRSLQ
jgi:3-phosphoshikimate 1-carboxyvinyltransferase